MPSPGLHGDQGGCHRGALAWVQNLPAMKFSPSSAVSVFVVCSVTAIWGQAAQAQVQLACGVTYAGSTQRVVVGPVADPYTAPSVDIAGRFLFKPIVVGHAQKIDRIVIYTYLDAQPHPVLIHQAKYLPPFAHTQQPWPLTGQHFLYGGPQERELHYSCTLEGWAP